MNNKLTFIDFFAGIGGFRKGMELAGHKCVGFCEFDKYATASYIAMHLMTEEQKNKILNLSMRQRQKEILKEEYRNGEWYENDITKVSARTLPKADCWCFGAPCVDFSVAGKREGLEGDKSSLVREIFRLLEEQEEQDRPEWLIYENVKGMLSSNNGLDYLSILSELDRLGYDIEWQNINSKWFVPQNRERIYTIGHLRRFGSSKIFPITGTDGENSIEQIGQLKDKNGRNKNQYRVYDPNGLCPSLNCMEGGGRQPNIGIKVIGSTKPQLHSLEDIHDITGISSCLNSRDYKCPKRIAIPCLTPDREKKRQNGRRLKDDGEPMFTLTAQDRHGVAIEPIGIIGGLQEHQTIREDDISPTLTSAMGMGGGQTPCVFLKQQERTKQADGIYVEMPGGFLTYCVWYEKYQCYIAIRKLTPKECFRLQGWSDEYFERAAFVNSDSQLYKQAGNGVTVNVVYAIGKKIKKTI